MCRYVSIQGKGHYWSINGSQDQEHSDHRSSGSRLVADTMQMGDFDNKSIPTIGPPGSKLLSIPTIGPLVLNC